MNRDFLATFERDIAKHEMQVIRDEGVNRHVRFKRPGTMCMHFDLITWPGYLCYTGDMGTYVFMRLQDMFEFFRARDGHDLFQIDRRYWAEKVQAADRADGIKEFSADKFKAEVMRRFNESFDDDDLVDGSLANLHRKAERHALRERIEDEVFGAMDWDDDEHGGRKALAEFKHDGRRLFDDFWEVDCTVYTHRFDWCCCALRWGISVYDKAKQATAEA